MTIYQNKMKSINTIYLPKIIYVFHFIIFIYSIIFARPQYPDEARYGTVMTFINLFLLSVSLFSIYFNKLTIAWSIFISIVFYQAYLPASSVYTNTFFIIGSIVLWWRSRMPKMNTVGISLFVISVLFAFNYIRDISSDDSFFILNWSVYFGCAGLLSGIKATNYEKEIKWDIIVLNIAIAITLTALASLVWVSIYSDLNSFGVGQRGRLSAMGAISANSAAAGWSIGVMVWMIYARSGGKLWLAITGAIICIYCIIMSRTWGASISLLICLPILLYRLIGKKQLFIYGFFIVMLILIYNEYIAMYVLTQFNAENKDLVTFSGRMVVWDYAIGDMFIYPIGHSMYEWDKSNPTVYTPHNIILQAGVFGGWIALVACLVVYYIIVGKLIIDFRKSNNWIILSLYILLSQMSIDVWYLYSVLLLGLYDVDGAFNT